MATWRPRALCDSRKQTGGQRWTLMALCVLALLPAVTHAQDVFNGASPQAQPEIYAGGVPSSANASDTFSASCISAQKPNIWKQLNVNPLTCNPQTMGQDSTGKCTLKGATLMSQQGGVCYYCEALNPPGQLYVPYDQVEATSQKGFLCGASPVDPGCMAVCSREFNATPVPPNTQPITGGGGTPLTATVTVNDDPCHPYYDLSTAAGQAAMQANAAKDAAACNESRCKHNPTLDVCKTVNLQASTSGGGEPAKKAQLIEGITPCGEDTHLGSTLWDPTSMQTLTDAVANAKQMLQTAKTLADKKTWDAATLAQAKLWFGKTDAETQQTIRNNINGELLLIQNMQTMNDVFGTGSTAGLPATTIAYVLEEDDNLTSPVIYVLAPFWKLPPTGSNSQASTVVHELSHYKLGGLTGDWNYGESLCQAQAELDPYLPFLAVPSFSVLSVVTAAIPAVGNYNPAIPKGKALTLQWVNGTASITNADSFKYFVYYVTHPQQ